MFFSKFSKYCFSQIVLNLDPRFARSDYRFRKSNEMEQSLEHSTNGASAERDGGAVGRGRLVPQWIDGFWRDWRLHPVRIPLMRSRCLISTSTPAVAPLKPGMSAQPREIQLSASRRRIHGLMKPW